MTTLYCSQRFEVAAGTVLGAEHRRVGRGNQDAAVWRHTRAGLVAVVADGCGSGGRSEVGAEIGASLWLEATARRLPGAPGPADRRLWSEVQLDVLTALRTLLGAMGNDAARVVSEQFLFTIVCAVVTDATAAVVAIGDGVVAVDGEVRELGPFPGNQPPYLSYALLGGDPCAVNIVESRPTASLSSIVIGTDGVSDKPDLVQRAIGDDNFTNPDRLRRRLALHNRDVVRVDWEQQRLLHHHGELPDDTTLIAIRRRSRDEAR